MEKRLWNHRIPTGAALIFLFLAIWVTSFFIQKGVIFVSRASPDKTPQNVVISNVTENSFTVNFTTTSQTVAGVSVEGAGAPFVAYDQRNKSGGEQSPFFSHYITVSDLSPKTNYRFSVLSDGQTFLNNGDKYTVTTGDKITSPPPTQNPIVGKILLPQGGSSADTIVELHLAGAQNITTLTKSTGDFIIPTNSIRTSTLDKYFTIPQDSEISLTVARADMKTGLKVLFKNAASIPPITLETNYDFTNVSQQVETNNTSSQLKAPIIKQVGGAISILSPKPSESFIDAQPLFRGTALPNQNVKIVIQGAPPSIIVKSDNNGIWSYRPTSAIPSGQHKITIQTVDKTGITKSLAASFTVFSAGSQVAQSATPSATPIVTATPTIAPTATPTIVPTGVTITPTTTVTSITPTITTTPTASSTPILTATPTIVPTATMIPTAIPTEKPVVVTPPPTGSNSSIALTVISAVLILAGSALLFLL